jgi:excisionase family DNA binding protein
MKWLTTEQAAAQLGVTRQRVAQLLRDASLAGEQVSGTVWLVDAESVARRKITNSGRGRRWDEDLVWDIIVALSTGGRGASREVGNRLNGTSADRLIKALGAVITVTRYDAAEDVSRFLVPTGVTAIETIGADLVADTRVFHGYARGRSQALIDDLELLGDPVGRTALHRFRSGEERVRDYPVAPRALVAVDCGSELNSRARSFGLRALEEMRVEWLARHTQ